MRLGRIIALCVTIAAAIAINIARSNHRSRPRTFGEVREQIMDEVADAKSTRGQPPQRPAGIDTRLPAAKAAEFGRLAAAAKNAKPGQRGGESFKAFYKAYEEITGSIDRELEAIDARTAWPELLSPARRAVLVAGDLDGEVNNGGFDQYYLNSSGDTAAWAPAAMRLLGQEAVASIVERANAVWGAGGPPPDRGARLAAMKKLPKSAGEAWSALDDEYYKLEIPGGMLQGVVVPFVLREEWEFFRGK